MALPHSMSCIVALILSVSVFSSMQLFKNQLRSSGPMSILGGGVGSVLFIFILTAIGNLEIMVFGKGFQTSITEVIISLIFALIASGMVHGICLTTCFIFSIIALYYVNRISQKTYNSSQNVQMTNQSQLSSKKKNK